MNQSPLLRTLLLILVAGIILVVAKSLLIPLAYALIIAMVL